MGTPATRNDPLPAFCFKIELELGKGHTGEAFFKSVSGLKYETEIIPVREGGSNDTTFNLPGATKWAPIVLRRGFTGSSELLDWREQWLWGARTRLQPSRIIQLDTALKARATWTFYRGWPTKWEVGELDASKNEIVIETLEIAIDGLRMERPQAPGSGT